MIRYRYGLPPLTPRDLYANNIATAFDFESPPAPPPSLPHPAHVIGSPCGAPVPIPILPGGIDGGTIIGTPPPVLGLERSAKRRAAERPKPHDLQNLISSGYLERLGFDYKPATAATMFRHPSMVKHLS
jgi:phospholipase C